ncbi:HEPN domain-containing protein [Desulfotignum balticum]|uniref:HEPN domain-containing protein n=1 Tax=Desulfotignum balticum TaxID=115781 RepID=UPI0004626187|nr:HEPN domain-containing protein [Desulfotignum balticum]
MPYKTSLISRFEAAISQVDELLAIHHYLQFAPVTEVTDNVLRASLTMMVSAIDTSVHELIISAIMFEIKEDKSIFKLDNVKIGALASKESDKDTRIRLIESDLRRQFSKESFQSSRQIENSLGKIGITNIWTKLASTLGQPPEDIKIKLDLLVRRRNQIVHEGDLDHLHSIRDIARGDLNDSLAFTKDLVAGMINEYTNLINV